MLTGYIPIAILLILSTGFGFLAIGLGGLFGPKRPYRAQISRLRIGHAAYWARHAAHAGAFLYGGRALHPL